MDDSNAGPKKTDTETEPDSGKSPVPKVKKKKSSTTSSSSSLAALSSSPAGSSPSPPSSRAAKKAWSSSDSSPSSSKSKRDKKEDKEATTEHKGEEKKKVKKKRDSDHSTEGDKAHIERVKEKLVRKTRSAETLMVQGSKKSMNEKSTDEAVEKKKKKKSRPTKLVLEKPKIEPDIPTESEPAPKTAQPDISTETKEEKNATSTTLSPSSAEEAKENAKENTNGENKKKEGEDQKTQKRESSSDEDNSGSSTGEAGKQKETEDDQEKKYSFYEKKPEGDVDSAVTEPIKKGKQEEESGHNNRPAGLVPPRLAPKATGSVINKSSFTTVKPMPLNPSSEELHEFLSPKKLLAAGLDRHNSSLNSLVTVSEGTKFFLQSVSPLHPSDLNNKDGEGNTPLHWACLLGQLELVRLLVRRGSKVSEKNNSGVTPLHYACSKTTMMHTLIAEMLILTEGRVNSKTKDNQTPLHFAVIKSRNIGKMGNIPTVQTLCKWKADVSIKDKPLQRTALHYAAMYGQAQVCNILIEKARSSVNVKDAQDMTPLHLAIIHGNWEVTQLLLMRGATLSLLTQDGSSPLHLACKYKRAQILDLLLTVIERNQRYFSLIDRVDKHGFTCIHWAAIKGDLECLKLFPDFLDIKDKCGLTPVAWAMIKGHRNCLHYLLAKKVKLDFAQFGGENGFMFPMAEDFRWALSTKEFSDISLKVEGHSFHGHKVVVSRCLKTYMKDDKLHQRLKIKNFSVETITDFCTYLYTGNIPSTEDRLKEILRVSNVYGLPFLRQLCENELMNKGKVVQRVSTLPLHLSQMLESAQYHDIIFLVDGKSFRLHKLVLSSRCQGLKDIIKRHTTGDPVELESVSKETFRLILEYLYTNAVTKTETLSTEELLLLYQGGHFLGLSDLMRKCEYYLAEHINDDNAADLLHTAENPTSHLQFASSSTESDSSDAIALSSFVDSPLPSMHILREACMSYIASDFKNLHKSGSLESLEKAQMTEVKKKQKEIKKEQDNLQKERKKTEKALKKISKMQNTNTTTTTTTLPSSATNENASSLPLVTPQAFFARRTTLSASSDSDGNRFLLRRPKLGRRNSSTW